MDALPCQPHPGPTVAHQLPGAGLVELLLLLLLSKIKHRSNRTAPMQPQLPDKVRQDLYSLPYRGGMRGETPPVFSVRF